MLSCGDEHRATIPVSGKGWSFRGSKRANEVSVRWTRFITNAKSLLHDCILMKDRIQPF